MGVTSYTHAPNQDSCCPAIVKRSSWWPLICYVKRLRCCSVQCVHCYVTARGGGGRGRGGGGEGGGGGGEVEGEGVEGEGGGGGGEGEGGL